MLSTIYLPPLKGLSKKTVKKLVAFIEKHEFQTDHGAANATLEDLNLESHTSLVTDMDADSTMAELVMELARKLGIPLALHYDATDDDDSLEWNVRSGIHWFDPETKKTHEALAGCNDPAPHFSTQDMLKIASSPYESDIFLQSLRVLQTLGVEPAREEPSETDIQAYVDAYVENRIEDAENNTSHKEEYAHCYRNGCPNPHTFSKTEILAETEATLQSSEK